MPCVRFEPTIPASERAKTVHALGRAATVTVLVIHILYNIYRRSLLLLASHFFLVFKSGISS
jgi:hypothetical protein